MEKSAYIRIRLTPEEKALVERQAEQLNYTVSELLRRLINLVPELPPDRILTHADLNTARNLGVEPEGYLKARLTG